MNERNRYSEHEPSDVRGFLEFLMNQDEELPEATPEIIDYLERVAGRQKVTDELIINASERVRRSLLGERLRAASERAVRPLGMHLRAQRLAAACSIEDVAFVVKANANTVRDLEEGTTSPLAVGAEFLARIARAFGVRLEDLRRAVTLHLLAPPATWRGTAIARRKEKRGDLADLGTDALSLAADDLRRARPRAEEVLTREQTEEVDRLMEDVARMLEISEKK
jgi:transcriptional regulator with XRE-family HTH domain